MKQKQILITLTYRIDIPDEKELEAWFEDYGADDINELAIILKARLKVNEDEFHNLTNTMLDTVTVKIQ